MTDGVANRPLVDAIRAGLRAFAEPQQALAAQAYMKSALPFHGVATPKRRELQAAAVQAWPCADTAKLAATMAVLWREATHREERYIAAELACVGRHRALSNLSLLPLYEEMISSGAWWDYCDTISGHALLPLLQRHPEVMKPRLRRWARGRDLWLRRAAITGQRSLKGSDFDARLLYATILPSIGDSPLAREFFLRKGIGWALRERAYQAPSEVRAFCTEYAASLSPLTVREALRRIGR